LPQAIYPSSTRAAPNELLFDLAPSGVYLAAYVTTCAVRSYRTISPLLLTIKNSNHNVAGTKPATVTTFSVM